MCRHIVATKNNKVGIVMAYKTTLNGETVYVYTESEHLKAVEYENLSHKAKQLLDLLGDEK